MNQAKTALLMAALTALLVGVGHIIDIRLQSNVFAFIFLIFGLGTNLVTYWFSDRIIFALYRVRPIQEQQAPALFNMVERLSQRAGIPMPKIGIIPMDTPNAFATGRNPSHASVCVTEGIMRLLPQRELEGVLAHEISHVKHYDTLIMTFCAAISGIISFVGRMAIWSVLLGGGGRDRRNGNALGALFIMILAPLLAVMIQLAISRSREFKADDGGGRLTGDPDALADALLNMEKYASMGRIQPVPATQHMFIINPAAGNRRGGFDLFSTHPATEKRVALLRELARRIG